jgi:hypothetical protein
MRSILAISLLCVLSATRVIAETTKSGFIKTSDGVRIHYVEVGEGDRLHPGMDGSASASEVAEQCRAPDLFLSEARCC